MKEKQGEERGGEGEAKGRNEGVKEKQGEERGGKGGGERNG